MHCLLISALVVWLVVAENTTAWNILLPTTVSSEKALQKREESEENLDDKDSSEKETSSAEDKKKEKEEKEGLDAGEEEKPPKISTGGAIVIAIFIVLALASGIFYFVYEHKINAKTNQDISMRSAGLDSSNLEDDVFQSAASQGKDLDNGPYQPKNKWLISTKDLEDDVFQTESMQMKGYKQRYNRRLQPKGYQEFQEKRLDVSIKDLEDEVFESGSRQSPVPTPTVTQDTDRLNRTINNRNYNSMQKTHTLQHTCDSLFDASMDSATVETWALDRKGSFERDGNRRGRGKEVKFYSKGLNARTVSNASRTGRSNLSTS